jgi:exonuclease SbcC
MKIRHIELRNFASHSEEAISLPESGIFFLDGPSGWGKSTFIIEAVQYALFGAKATRMKQEKLRHVDYPDEQMSVKIAFEFDGGELLVVERGLSERGKPYATLIDGEGVILREGPKAVDAFIRQRLGGLSWQQLRHAFVCHQEEVTALTSLQPAKRKEAVHRLLGIRELELAQEVIKERIRKQRAELDLLERELAGQSKEQAQASLAEREEELEGARAAHARVAQELRQAGERRAESVEALAPLREAVEAAATVERLRSSLERARGELAAARERLSRHEQAQSALAGESDLLDRLELARAELERIEAEGTRARRRQELEAAVAAARERVAALGALLPSAVGAGAPAVGELGPEELAVELQALETELRLLEEEIEQRRHDLRRLAEQGTCFTCSRPLGEGPQREDLLARLRAQLSQRELRRGELEERIVILRADLPRSRAQAAESERRRLEEAGERAKLEQAELELEQLLAAGEPPALEISRERYRSKRLELLELERRRAELDVARRDLDPQAAEDHERAAQACASLERELAQASARTASEQAASLAALQAAEEELRALDERIATLSGQLPLLAETVSRSERELAQAQAAFQRLSKRLQERERVNDTLLALESLSDYLEAFTRQLAAEIRPAIEEMASEMLYKMSNGEFIALAIDENYAVRVQRQEGNWLDPDMLSTGEKVRANLCLRLALTRLVSQRTGVPVQFVILDEPFGNLDKELIDVSMGLLDGLRAFYPQCFLISHTGDLGSSPQVDYRIAFEAMKGRRRIKLYAR